MNRSQPVYINSKISNSLNVDPNGSTLDLLLFCIYINDISDVFYNCDVHMNADDVQFYRINDDLRKINNWANANGFSIYPSKSNCLLLSRTKRAFDVPDIIRRYKIDF